MGGSLDGRADGRRSLVLCDNRPARTRAEVPEFGVGSGLNDFNHGFRVRYEIRREYSPYVGVSWLWRFAGTSDLASLTGEAVSDLAAVGVVGCGSEPQERAG